MVFNNKLTTNISSCLHSSPHYIVSQLFWNQFCINSADIAFQILMKFLMLLNHIYSMLNTVLARQRLSKNLWKLIILSMVFFEIKTQSALLKLSRLLVVVLNAFTVDSIWSHLTLRKQFLRYLGFLWDHHSRTSCTTLTCNYIFFFSTALPRIPIFFRPFWYPVVF